MTTLAVLSPKVDPIATRPGATVEPVARLHFPRLAGTDIIAGASVAMVLIPQSLAYAELAGLPPYLGLFASAFPLLAFALLASSPYLQTGPVAVTSLLTAAALPAVEPGQLPALAALLALMVGVMRFLLGVGRLGQIVRLMSSPVVMGFTSGAAVLILSSQLPKSLGVDAPDGTVLGRAFWSITHPSEWLVGSLILSAITIVLFIGGRKISALFPGVLVAVVIGIVYSQVADYSGPIVGEIPEGLPPFSLSMPWDQIPVMFLGALIIALVGFAEPASIARTFANETGEHWDANREMVASGIANLVSSISGGYPVGGSFSRSSVNKMAGAKTRWSGGITGLIVIGFLPFARVLQPLPTAILGAIVLGAASSLVKPVRLLRLWQRSPSQALLAWATAAATLAFAPRIERAVVLGIVLTVVVHLVSSFKMNKQTSPDGTVTVQPNGLMWIATDTQFANELRQAAAESTQDVQIDFARTPFLDAPAIVAMSAVATDLSEQGRSFSWTNAPAGTERMLSAVHAASDIKPAAITQTDQARVD